MTQNIDLKKRVDELENELNYLRNSNIQEIFSFDFLFDAVKQPAFILRGKVGEKSLKIEKVNKSGVDLLKFSRDEIVKLSPIDLGIFSSEDQYQKFSSSLSKNESITYLAKINTKNEHTISSEITLYSFSDKNTIHLMAFQRNIGNQQKVVEALRQSEYRFLQMAENLAEGIEIIEDEKTVFVNSRMCQITGYQKDELKLVDEFSLALPYEVDRIKAFKEKINESTQGIHAIEFWIRTKSGQEKCIKNNYTFSLRTDGRKTTYIITSDISARKRIEQALRKSQTEFRMLAENSPDMITRYNKDLTYTYANLTIEKITNIPVSQFIGRNNHELNLEAELVSFLEEMHLEVFRTGRTLKFEFRMSNDNDTKIFQAQMVPELANDGTVETVLTVSRDITQIKQVERNLKEEKEKIIKENYKISKNLKEWSKKLCEKNDKLEKNCFDPIHKIADWAEYGHNSEMVNPKTISVNNFLKDFFNTKATIIEEYKLEANIILPVHEISIYTDENLLFNTLNLLLENAIEATEEGKVEIGYDIYNENEIVFFVKDTGVGIDPDNTEKIFEPFISIAKENHAGLGLSISQKNVDVFGGIIWCLSSVGTGSTFCFTHPAKIEQNLLQTKSETLESIWKDKSILIVEDTNTNFLLLESLLLRYDVKITRALTGHEAIQFMKDDSTFDLILMDIQLPGINGYEATTEIRKFNKEIPIIAQTAYAMYDDVVKALDAGCNDFIAKPIKSKKLLGLIDKYLSK
ncbi:MAG: response regulator [Bacteroidales bacterium]|nr:response regulator [Bacteroidales bacterium]